MRTNSIVDRGTPEYRELFRNYLRRGAAALTDAELRTLSLAGSGLGSGIAPTGWNDFIDAAIEQDAILSRVRRVQSAERFSVPIYVGSEALNNTSVVARIDVTAGGSSYTSAPTVTFTGGGGSGATATATVSGGAVTAISVTAGGTSYSTAPTVTFTGGGGSGAAATATVSSGAVTAISVTAGGSGYTSAPTIGFTGGGGSGAAATATVSGGPVTAISVTNTGSGYTSAPTIGFSGGGGSAAAATAVLGTEGLRTESYTSGTAFALPQQGSGGSTTYTFQLKKVHVWCRVSNELLEDSSSAASVETFLMQEMASELRQEINRQILIGNGTSECQGAFNSAKAYSRTASTGVATTNKISDILAAAWGATNSALPPMSHESYVNSVAVINARLTASFDSTFYPPLFPVFMGNMKSGTTVEGLPTIHYRLSATTPAAGDTLVMLFDPTKYLLATNFAGFTVTRLSERYSDSDTTAFVASVRADGCLLHSSGVLNVNRA